MSYRKISRFQITNPMDVPEFMIVNRYKRQYQTHLPRAIMYEENIENLRKIARDLHIKCYFLEYAAQEILRQIGAFNWDARTATVDIRVTTGSIQILQSMVYELHYALKKLEDPEAKGVASEPEEINEAKTDILLSESISE